jgi:hypothetical protein
LASKISLWNIEESAILLRSSLNCCIQVILMAVSSFQAEELPDSPQLDVSSVETAPGKNLWYVVKFADKLIQNYMNGRRIYTCV